jgi:hypothetical protein
MQKSGATETRAKRWWNVALGFWQRPISMDLRPHSFDDIELGGIFRVGFPGWKILRRAKNCLHFYGTWGLSYVPRLPA